MLLLLFSLFKNISYPLLWNDEAETAMYATRIMEYGYPKVHDGKNVVYLFGHNNIAIDKGTDAYIGSVWGQYYFATIGAFLAKSITNIYMKTAVMRIPFAIMGFLGLAIMVLSVTKIFDDEPKKKLPFISCFLLLELSSVPLALHLREVRHYPLTLFFSGCVLYFYIRSRFVKDIAYIKHLLCIAISLLLLYITFPPIYITFIVVILSYESFGLLLKQGGIKKFLHNVLPMTITMIVMVPLILFFKTFHLLKIAATTSGNTWLDHLINFLWVLEFLQKYEFLYVAVVSKIISNLLWFYLKAMKSPSIEYSSPHVFWIKNELKLSNFLGLFFIVTVFVVSKNPWQRYYISLQPILILILLIDIFALFEIVGDIQKSKKNHILHTLSVILISALFLLNTSPEKIVAIRLHIYELFHQYKGPLDIAIPYITSRFNNTEDLIIATNYEECSYMYYLKSKVIMGFIPNNLEEDLKASPDIIIPRKKWHTLEMFQTFLQKNKYHRINLPIRDTRCNNIPELPCSYDYNEPGLLIHLFKTPIPSDANDCLEVYIKEYPL